jgi:transcription factor IIIB 90 kDa subunit
MGFEGLINDSMPPKDPEEGGLLLLESSYTEETQYKKIIWEEMNKEYLEVGNSVYGRIFSMLIREWYYLFFILQEQAAKEALAAELAATGIDPEAGKKVSNNVGQPNFLFNFGN